MSRNYGKFPTDQELKRRGYDPLVVKAQRKLVMETNFTLDAVRSSDMSTEEKKAKIAEIKAQHEVDFKAIK